MAYSVFSTKPGGSDKEAWKWVLTLRGEGLSRYGAAQMVQAIKAEDKALRCVVYSYGHYRYTV